MHLWPLGKVKQKRGEEMKMRTLLVDSDETLRTNLWNLLKLYQNFALEGEADTAEATVSFVQQHPVDVIFINHQPAEPCRTSTGDWVAYLLAQTHPDVQVVLYADTADWAFQAFRSQCAGYLLLPFDPLALQALVNRLRYVFDLQQTKREAANRSLLIKTRSGYQLTPVRRRDPPDGLHNEPVGTDAGRVRFLPVLPVLYRQPVQGFLHPGGWQQQNLRHPV